MKLVHVSIHNFRGVHDASINLFDYNLLVGPNNAGKSTVMAAILVFLSDESFYGAKNVQSGKFGDIVFIPAVSKLDEHTKLSGPSALRDLLSNVLEAVVASSPAYEAFSRNFEAFAQGVKTEKTGDGRSLAGLEADLSGLLESWGTAFQLDMKSPSMAEIIKTLVSYQCIDSAHGKALSADQCGSGFQRHFIYSLIQIGAKYVSKKPSKKTKDFTPSETSDASFFSTPSSPATKSNMFP